MLAFLGFYGVEFLGVILVRRLARIGIRCGWKL
jgi:hypothetical protein